MAELSRRDFIYRSSALLTATLMPLPLLACQPQSKRLFRMSLNPGAIGVQINQDNLLDTAIQYGFEAIVPFPEELQRMNKAQERSFLQKKQSHDISWDAADLPVDFRKTKSVFQKDLLALPQYARAMQRFGANRMNTWIMPCHEQLTYRQNFKQHVERLKEVAAIIGDYDIKLGLEYVGPKTLLTKKRFSFIRTMKEAQELITEIAAPNVGLQLDSFHWYCAEESMADIISLEKDMIVTVDLNDATPGRTVAEQIDNERMLPGDSGMIDLRFFLGALLKIGYNGPVRAEPFNKTLSNQTDQLAIEATYKAMKKSFDLIN